MLIWSAAVATVVRYAAAFIASDSVTIEAGLSSIITYAMGFSGLGMGVLDVFGGAYLFDGWRRVLPRNDQSWPFKFKVLTLFAVGLVVNGILILIPFTMSRVSGNTMHGILGDGYWLFGWSLVVNIAPYQLIGGVTVGNQIVSIKPEESFGNFPGNFPEPEKLSEKVPQWRTFRKKVSNDELLLITNMVPSVIAQKYGLTVKAAKDWPAYANLTSEEEGVALLAGADLGGARGVLLIQSSGVGNCINMLSLIEGSRFPFLCVVSMRGQFGEGNPWQYAMGQAVETVLSAMGVICLKVDRPEEVAGTVQAALTKTFKSGRSVAVLLGQKLLGAKKF